MASQPGNPDPRPGPQHFVPPTARQLRAEAIQRLQAGLFGLAAVVLLVGLANIINERARQGDPAAAAVAAPAAVGEGGDPLADVGVVPAAAPEPAPANSAAARK